MSINCCNGCVPPKRNPYCHGYCPEYATEKAQDEAEKAEAKKQQAISNDIYFNRCTKVVKALKRRIA